MMIFDCFPTLANAEAFALAAQDENGDPPIICLNQEDFDKHEVFPWEIEFPAVLVPRLDDMMAESRLEGLVGEFGGEFAGT